jgi:ketosteroid isomerase-like protein
MAEHPNPATIRRAFEAFAGGDIEVMRSLVAEAWWRPEDLYTAEEFWN